MTLKKFKQIEKLLQKYHDELQANAQGDNGQDVKDRLVKYWIKLEELLAKN